MEKVKRIARGAGKVSLALLGGVLIPILTPVALGVAVNQRVREKRLRQEPARTIGQILAAAGLTIQGEATGDKSVAVKVFMQQPVSEIGKLVAKAGLSIQEEAPRHCWEILHCSLEKREACPAYARRDVPSWVAVGLGKDERISDVCVNHTLIDLRALPRQA